MARKITDIVQVKLRIPEWLRRKVLEAAKKSGRSLNGELFHLIEEGLARPEYESLIKSAAETASATAASRTMAELAELIAHLTGDSASEGVSKLVEAVRAIKAETPTHLPSLTGEPLGMQTIPHTISSRYNPKDEDKS